MLRLVIQALQHVPNDGEPRAALIFTCCDSTGSTVSDRECLSCALKSRSMICKAAIQIHRLVMPAEALIVTHKSAESACKLNLMLLTFR